MDEQGNREETDRTMNGTFEAYKTVAFDIIREQLADLANSAEAREMARGLCLHGRGGTAKKHERHHQPGRC